MKIVSSGKYAQNNVVKTSFLSVELQDKLNGLNLEQAQQQGLITAEKFQRVVKTYTGFNGSEQHEAIDLLTDKGAVRVSRPLGKELAKWADNLGDLIFKVDHTDPEFTKRPSVRTFYLQRPGGGIEETREDLGIGQ